MQYFSWQGTLPSSVTFIAPAVMKAIVTISMKPKLGGSAPSMYVAITGATNIFGTVEGWEYAGDYFLPVVTTYLVTLNAGANSFSVRPTNALTATDTFVTIMGSVK
jgi:hypothetical protein